MSEFEHNSPAISIVENLECTGANSTTKIIFGAQFGVQCHGSYWLVTSGHQKFAIVIAIKIEPFELLYRFYKR